jgi:hypothetical protein
MDFKIMKKIVFGLLMTMGMLNAQNNLVFNQVLNFNITTSDTATVPEGKVWKIERAKETIIADKQDVNYGAGSIGGYYYGTDNNNNALWFSEGTTIRSNTNFMSLSILEFDVVPTSTGTGSGTGGGGVSSDGLVFSGVINQFIPTSSVAGSFGTVAGFFTVPEGKIWKINNMTHNKISSSTGGLGTLNGALYVSMDGIPIYGIGQNNNVVSDTTTNTILTPGTYELKWYQGSGAGGPFYCGTITHLVAIEYNLP